MRRLRSSSAVVKSGEPGGSWAGSCADAIRGSRPRIGSIATITRGIVWLVKREKFDTRRLRSLQFGFGVLARADTWGTLQAAAARQIGQRHKGGVDTPVVPDKIMKGTGADVFAADPHLANNGGS